MTSYLFKNRIDARRVLKFFILLSFIPLTYASSSSLESLKEVAQQCRQKVDELWQWRRRLPSVQRRDFHIAIGQASKSCDDLRDLLKQFEQADGLKQAYEKSMNEAQYLTQALQEIP